MKSKPYKSYSISSNNLFLELHVQNLQLAKTFYLKLGFIPIFETPVGENLGYFVMQMKDTILIFYGGDERIYQHEFFKEYSSTTKKGYGVEITIVIDNIDVYYNQLVKHVNKYITQKLTTKRWGKRDFRLVDPFGFYFRFTELTDWQEYLIKNSKESI